MRLHHSAAAIRGALACSAPRCECQSERATAKVHCPSHADKHPSFSVTERDGRVLVRCHAGCEQSAVIAALRERVIWPDGGRGRSYPRRAPARLHTPSASGCTVAQYAAAKNLPEAFLRSPEIGLSDITYQGAPAVRIPYFNRTGEETVSVQFRVSLDSDPRFKWKTGNRAALYGSERIPKATARIALVEGPSDCHTLWFADEPAIGVPSASLSEELLSALADLLAKVKLIYLVREPGDAGQKLAEKIGGSPLRDRVRVLDLAPHKDPSAMYLTEPATFRERWRAALAGAAPLTAILSAEDDLRRADHWGRCRHIATAPRILDLAASAIERHGVVGEREAALLIFLVIVSRLLRRPVSAAVKGVSASGKSYIVERVLSMFAPDAYYALTAMSERALAYSEEPLRHRVLVLYEAAGLRGDFSSYLVRSLLSEGRVRYETVEKTKDGLRPRLIEREGPTALLLTTTAARLHPENETRIFSIPVSDTTEQTARILNRLGADGDAPHLAGEELAEWHALSEWLALSVADVAIPFGELLAKEIPPVAVRLRRDVGAVLNLIRAHTLLHQASRQRDDRGRVVAELADYAEVRGLVADLVSEGVGRAVPSTIRDTVDAVDALIQAGVAEPKFTDVARELKVDRSAAQRRCLVAIDRGYLQNLEDRPRRPARLALGDALPGDDPVLPPIERVQECMRNAGVTTALPAPDRLPQPIDDPDGEIVMVDL